MPQVKYLYFILKIFYIENKNCLNTRQKLGTRNVLQNLQIDPWDMLNNFCFNVYAQKSLFIDENDNVYFWTAPPYPVSLRVH